MTVAAQYVHGHVHIAPEMIEKARALSGLEQAKQMAAIEEALEQELVDLKRSMMAEVYAAVVL